jgi:hypothetical protein
MKTRRARRVRHLREYRADHPSARENSRQMEMLAQTLEILGQHLERGTWPSKSWMLSEAKAPYGGIRK